MKKKLVSLAIATVLVLAALPLFAAFEAHIINVRCYVENALAVTPTGEIDLGTVFPNEVLDPVGSFTISMSKSFLITERVRDVKYQIVQKSKNHVQGTGYGALYWDTHNLSGWLTEHKNSYEGEENDNSQNHTGMLDKAVLDYVDNWVLDLRVPPIQGHLAQSDMVPGIIPLPEEGTYGCDLWIETTGFSYPQEQPPHQPYVVGFDDFSGGLVQIGNHYPGLQFEGNWFTLSTTDGTLAYWVGDPVEFPPHSQPNVAWAFAHHPPIGGTIYFADPVSEVDGWFATGSTGSPVTMNAYDEFGTLLATTSGQSGPGTQVYLKIIWPTPSIKHVYIYSPNWAWHLDDFSYWP